ncbi:MAG: polysaccharide lyase 6 family protein [Rikenellaceae bacterium]
MKTLKFNSTSILSLLAAAGILFGSCCGGATSIEKAAAKVATASPGDTILVANGTYRDVAIELRGAGTAEAPIVIMAEEPGKVIISGNSTLRFGGDHIVFSGFLFADGYTDTGSVVDFKLDDKVSVGCRFTNNAIISYNPADKWVSYRWVSMSGRYNRVDHNSFVGKLNAEVVLAVDMAEEESTQPNHRIDHNYFGARQNLGSNGGETIRVGNSQVSMIPDCDNILEYNYFEQCNGEVEVLSLKSSDNIVRHNVFKDCTGVLAIRHGDRNWIEGNLFDGGGIAATGGVRVVGAGHTIVNNVFYKLRGVRFFSALALMNAVPNSTPNRYMQVADVEVKNNSFYDCSNLEFGTGSDNERTLAPERISLTNNAIYGAGNPAYLNKSSMVGCNFSGNVMAETAATKAIKGLTKGEVEIIDHQGVKVVRSKSGEAGVAELRDFIIRDQTGAAWYEQKSLETRILSGNTITIGASQNSLADAVESASNGDVIILSEAGEYHNDRTVVVDKYLIIKSADNLTSRPSLRYTSKLPGSIMMIADGGDLDIRGIGFDGAIIMGYDAPNSAISTAAPMIQPFGLEVDNCEFHSFYETPASCIRVYKGAFANNIKIQNSLFYDCSSDAINLSNEKDDNGRYSAELVEVYNTVFFRMMAGALNVYRGGNDESTSGPTVLLADCSFIETNNREQGSVVRLIGVQKARIDNCNFYVSGSGGASIRFEEMRWDDIQMSNINLWESGRIDTFWGVPVKNQTKVNPKFKDIENLDFTVTAPAIRGVGASI